MRERFWRLEWRVRRCSAGRRTGRSARSHWDMTGTRHREDVRP